MRKECFKRNDCLKKEQPSRRKRSFLYSVLLGLVMSLFAFSPVYAAGEAFLKPVTKLSDMLKLIAGAAGLVWLVVAGVQAALCFKKEDQNGYSSAIKSCIAAGGLIAIDVVIAFLTA